jgi:SAM-dependent methyltransferase
MSDDDVPSPIDLRDPATARTWADQADVKKPQRREVRACIAERVHAIAARRVVELGSGPGQLAEAILAAGALDYTCLDFSPPFLDMCRARLGDRARYVLADYLDPAWTAALEPPFDAVVTMQAVHELRHKRRAATLYAQVLTIVRPGGLLVVCDHEPTAFENTAIEKTRRLYSTVAEQHAAFTAAGFTDVTTVLELNGMYVCSGRRGTIAE